MIVGLRAALAGRYEIEREIGRGGMATVFAARDVRHGRPVALKVVHPELAAANGPERFAREVRIAAGLHHPHIVPLLDSGVATGLAYYVMPYATGGTLRDRLKREPQLPVDEALRIAGQIADALGHAHRHGVVHRDIKPENILFEEGHALVTDFGIARAISGPDRALTTAGFRVGTPTYMSPEQVTGGDASLDGRSDLYSLGCVLYEMLGGQPPFTGATAEGLALQHLSAPPRPITDLRPGIPEPVARAIEKLLTKSVRDRFQTAEEVMERLRDSHVVPSLESEDTVPIRRVRSSWITPARIALIVASLGAAVWAGMSAGWIPKPPFRAPAASNHALPKDWMFVAEFEGPPADSELTATVRDLVCAGVDQSGVVATCSRSQMREALRMAGKPLDSRVDVELACDLAIRNSARTVLAGKLGRLGTGFSIVVQLLEADSARVLFTETATAASESQLIPAVDRIARNVRRELGEKQSEVRQSRTLLDVMTPSLPAYRLFSHSVDRLNHGALQDARVLAREAIAADTAFAAAWSLLGNLELGLGEFDSARYAWRQSLRFGDRLDLARQLQAEGSLAQLDGDYGRAIAAYDRVITADPGHVGALANSAVLLAQLGRFEEARDRNLRAIRASRFPATYIRLSNDVSFLASMGRLAEAEARCNVLVGFDSASTVGTIQIEQEEWAKAEQTYSAMMHSGALADADRVIVLWSQAQCMAARGAISGAMAAIAEVQRLNQPLPSPGEAWRAHLMYAASLGRSRDQLPLTPPADTSIVGKINQGLAAALRGDTLVSMRVLRHLRRLPAAERRSYGASAELLQGLIDLQQGHLPDAIRVLRPVAAQVLEIGPISEPAGMSAIRWFLADAYERAGQPDSAAACLEHDLREHGTIFQDGAQRPFFNAQVHRRLALIYARIGRLAEARRHAGRYLNVLRSPDPESQALVAEVRSALSRAEAAAARVPR